MQIDHIAISAISRSKLPQSLFEKNIQELGSVLVEHKYYDPEEKEIGIKRMQARVQHLAEHLQTSGPTDSHAMRCLRWCHEPECSRFGLVLEPPRDHVRFASLRDIIENAGSGRRPTLGQRFSIVRVYWPGANCVASLGKVCSSRNYLLQRHLLQSHQILGL